MSHYADQRRLFFVFFAVVAVMAAVIAGLVAAILRASGMEIASAAAITFVTLLTLSMSAYAFLEHQSQDV